MWFRPSPKMPSHVLLGLIENHRITATPRLGVRDESHPKGYRPDQEVTLRAFDEQGKEMLTKRARIVAIRSKQLQDLVSDDLDRSDMCSLDWESVRQKFSFFEARPLPAQELISIVEFTYIT
ncbi:MAG: hypothetical protein P4M11_04940 [Candidatus Pacebacteria bacterium]|nr:hypothetical protein [Candidatus Paceibacterota bacterium]